MDKIGEFLRLEIVNEFFSFNSISPWACMVAKVWELRKLNARENSRFYSKRNIARYKYDPDRQERRREVSAKHNRKRRKDPKKYQAILAANRRRMTPEQKERIRIQKRNYKARLRERREDRHK